MRIFPKCVLLVSLIQTITSIATLSTGDYAPPTCGYPGMPAHAVMVGSAMTQFTKGESITYRCEEGYVLVGPETRECMAWGWSRTRPVCSEFPTYIFGQNNSSGHFQGRILPLDSWQLSQLHLGTFTLILQ